MLAERKLSPERLHPVVERNISRDPQPCIRQRSGSLVEVWVIELSKPRELSTAQEDLETMQAFAQVFNKLTRCYKYLEKDFEDEVKKLLLFLKGFSESERNKLAMLTGVLLANGTLNASILNSLYNENLVKEGN